MAKKIVVQSVGQKFWPRDWIAKKIEIQSEHTKKKWSREMTNSHSSHSSHGNHTVSWNANPPKPWQLLVGSTAATAATAGTATAATAATAATG